MYLFFGGGGGGGADLSIYFLLKRKGENCNV